MVRIGSDPEFFVKDTEGNPVPAEFLFPPEGSGETNKPFFDGWQAELTTDPVDDISEVIPHIKRAVKSICEIREAGIEPYLQPAIEVSRSSLDMAPPSAFAFGCSPSVNAFSSEVRDSQTIRREWNKQGNIFMAGGHIHLGMPGGANKANPVERLVPHAATFTIEYPNIIRMFETVGVTLLTAAESIGGDVGLFKKRRMFYGRSGEYRNTRYGIEMRSPSCIWLMCPDLAEAIYASAAISYYTVFAGMHESVIEAIDLDKLQYAVNESDSDVCMEIHKKAVEIIQAEFGSKHDVVIGTEAKYKNIWGYLASVFERLKAKTSFYSSFPSLEKAWGL